VTHLLLQAVSYADVCCRMLTYLCVLFQVVK
jgi:hypothetical protein